MNTYGRLPVTFARGEGAWLWDTKDNKYLDALSGVAVCGLGHSHPAITEAICRQAGQLLHTSNWYGISHQQSLATALCGQSNMESVFFCNSGAEANEAAIKLARLSGHQREINEPTIIVMENSFHGRTLATLSATGSRKVQAGFEPLVRGFYRVPYNDLDSVEQVSRHNDNVVAVLVEPVLGEGGVVIPDNGYMAGLRKICDQHGWLLMLDEIQTGMCRTGKWFACQHESVLPDVMTLAKGLGNGFPIGACLARGAAAETLRPGSHGSTFGGNPLACQTALAVIDTMKAENVAQRAAQLGERIVSGLKAALSGFAAVTDIRGKGMMIGIELDRPCPEVMKIALTHKLLVNVTAENVIRLLPPLLLSDEEADQIVQRVTNSVQEFLSN